MGNILTVSALAIIALSMLWSIIFKKNAVIRFFCVLIRAVLAFVGTMILKSQLVSRSEDLIAFVSDTFKLDASVAQTLAQSPELTDIALSLSGALVAVVAFLLLYFALGIVMLLIRLILMIIIRPKGANIAVRAACGALQGFILVTCLLIPISTYVGIADTALPTVKELAPETDLTVIEEPINELDDCIAMKAHRLLGGDVLSNELTSMKLRLGDDTVKTNLNNEIDAVMKIAVDVSSLMKVEIANYTEKETAIIENIGDYVTSSKLLGAILTNVISDATDAWEDGNTYMGMAKPALDPTFDPLVNKTISIIGTDAHNAAHLGEDISTFGKLASKILAATATSGGGAEGGAGEGSGEGAGSGDGSGEGASGPNLVETIMADGMVKDLLDIVNENPRMRPLIPAITNIGLSFAAQALGIDADSAAAYQRLAESIALELKNNASLTPDERQASMESTLSTTLDTLGITDIDDTEIAIISMSVIAYFDGEVNKAPTEATADDVSAFLDEMTDTVNTEASGSMPTGAKGAYGQSKLNANTQISGATAGKLIADICAIQSDASLNAAEKEARIADLLASSPIFTQNGAGLSSGKIADIKLLIVASADRPAEKSGKALACVGGLIPEGNTSFKLTAAAILIDDDIISGDISKESMGAIIDSVTGVFAGIMDIMSSLDGGSMSHQTLVDICTTMGDMFDTLSGIEDIYGEEKTDTLMKTVLNSGMVKGMVSVNALDIKNLIDARNEKDVSYSALMNTLSQTVNTFDSIQSGQALTMDKVGQLLDTLVNENSCQVIAVMITPEKLEEFGFAHTTPEKLRSAAMLFHTVFNNLAIESEEQRSDEIEAFKHIITIAATANASDSDEMFGADGPFGCEASEIIDTVLKSTSISKSLAQVDLTGNPFGLGLSASDTAEMVDAINARLVNADEQTVAALNSLADLFGIEL